MMSMFQAITGGVDWGQPLEPLVSHVSPAMAFLFSFYIAFSILAMLNVVTGVFVESVLASAKKDKDLFMVNNARELFQTDLEDHTGLHSAMTWEVFEGKMDAPQMQEFFKAIDVHPSEAKGLFDLLDLDNSGSISADEFLNGCFRLRGAAKALDLALLIQEVRQMDRRMKLLIEVQARQRHAWTTPTRSPRSPIT